VRYSHGNMLCMYAGLLACSSTSTYGGGGVTLCLQVQVVGDNLRTLSVPLAIAYAGSAAQVRRWEWQLARRLQDAVVLNKHGEAFRLLIVHPRRQGVLLPTLTLQSLCDCMQVSAVIACAREAGVPYVPRGGGHSYEGESDVMAH
jgi:hypothetical protein